MTAMGTTRYIFGRGSGHDIIFDRDKTPGNVDTVRFTGDISPTDITLRRNEGDLEFIINESDRAHCFSLVLYEYWYRIERIEFPDGTVWGTRDIEDILVKGTEDDDIIDGFSGNDPMGGLRAATTTLSGGAGDDTLDGGAGNDRLLGGAMVMIVTCSAQVQGRIIMDQDKTPGNFDIIQLGQDISTDDVTVQNLNGDLALSLNGSADKLTVTKWFWNDSGEYQVECIQFSDGTTWDVDAIKQRALLGTPGPDALIGYSSPDVIQGYDGEDTLFGRSGDDILEGGAGDDTVYGEPGDDTLRGGAGDDVLLGGAGDDILDGGAGDDRLNGGDGYEWYGSTASNGNDTYLFGRGSGQDTIVDFDQTAGNIDTIRFADNIAPADVQLHRTGDDLDLSISGSTDRLTVRNWFYYDGVEYQMKRIEFADGAVWDVDTIKQMALQGTPDDDLLVGYSTDDTIQGYNGADLLYGREGADILDGGAGNDGMDGGTGNDTYVFGRGSGQDIVIDKDNTPGNVDTILLNADVTPGDVRIRHSNDDLVLSIDDTSDTLTVNHWFDESDEWQVEQVRFADGTTWDADAIRQMALQGTPQDDVLVGYSSADTINGFAGNDRLEGWAGDDILDGGPGNDSMDGGTGNDTYLFGRGSGQDTIVDYDRTSGNIDIVLLGDNVLPSDITLRRGGEDLFISINGTTDRLQLSEWFSNDAYKIERLQFSNGTVWDATYMQQLASIPTDTDDYLVGTSANDMMDGGGGDDEIYGRAGDDTLFGGSGYDFIDGEDGDDSISGGSEDDHIEGGTGRNVLEGGTGNDEIIADQGINTFVFNQGDGFDNITSRFLLHQTAGGAVMVKDILPGSEGGADIYNFEITEVNGTLFFTADDGVHGIELWKSDGTEAGTSMFKDLNPGGDSDIDRLIDFNGTLFFTQWVRERVSIMEERRHSCRDRAG